MRPSRTVITPIELAASSVSGALDIAVLHCAYSWLVGLVGMTIKPIAVLRQVFPGMDKDALRQMATLARIQTYPPGTLLCQEGADEEVFYIIGEGQVRVTQRMGAEERFLRTSGPGEYFGEMALIANTPRNASVRTLTQTTVLEVDKDTFIEMIRQNPVIALTMFRTTIGWLRANDATAIAALSAQKEAVEQAYAELRTQERLRSEFLTTLAHELRTPLTSANGFMQLIRAGNMPGPALQMGLDKVAAGLEQIVSLFNDLMFIQEMDLLEPTIRTVSLPEILMGLVADEEDKAAAQNLKIRLTIPAFLPELQADPDTLTRAFRALLNNAIKFSLHGGEIQIDVAASESHLNVAFTDPGIGIDPAFIVHIFERFKRQEQYGDQLFNGMGLGLPIAKHLIESFGGSISVKSEVGRGSTFTVHLPVLNPTALTKLPTEPGETIDWP